MGGQATTGLVAGAGHAATQRPPARDACRGVFSLSVPGPWRPGHYSETEGQADGWRRHHRAEVASPRALGVRSPLLPPGDRSSTAERLVVGQKACGFESRRSSQRKVKPTAGDGSGPEHRRGESPWGFDPPTFRHTVRPRTARLQGREVASHGFHTPATWVRIPPLQPRAAPRRRPHVAGWSSGYLAWSTARRPRVRIPSLPPGARRGSCSPHQSVTLAPHTAWGGRRVVQFHHDPPRQGKWTEWRRHPAATRVSVGSIPTLPSTQAPSLPTGRMPGFQPGDAGSTPAGVANTGDVAQPASAPDCLSGPCGFESHRPRHGPWPKR